LNELEELHHIKLIPGVPRILMAWPFSNIPTQYKVKSEDGKEYFANCAWDAIAFHIVLKQSIEITSFCYHCNHLINLTITKDSIITKNPESFIVNFSKPISQWMNNVIDTCGNTMNFFYSKQHLKEYWDLNPNKPNFTFTDDQIISFCKLIYTNRAEIDYERPNTEKMKNFLKQEGLIGEFWFVNEYH
jgi:carboxypeptidase C (cathepsin A)